MRCVQVLIKLLLSQRPCQGQGKTGLRAAAFFLSEDVVEFSFLKNGSAKNSDLESRLPNSNQKIFITDGIGTRSWYSN